MQTRPGMATRLLLTFALFTNYAPSAQAGTATEYSQHFGALSKLSVAVAVLDCPHYPAAMAELKSILAAERISSPISEILVANHGMAKALKFRGSPTIRINGLDIAGESDVQHFAVSCRLYPGGKRPGVPPAQMIHRAIREAMRGEKQ